MLLNSEDKALVRRSLQRLDEALPEINQISAINGFLEIMLLTDGFKNLTLPAVAQSFASGDRETVMGGIFLGFTIASMVIEKIMKGRGTRICLAATDLAEDLMLIGTGLMTGNVPQAINGAAQIVGDAAASLTDPLFAQKSQKPDRPLMAWARRNAANIAFASNVMGAIPMLALPGDESTVMRAAAAGWLLTCFLRWRDDRWQMANQAKEAPTPRLEMAPALAA